VHVNRIQGIAALAEGGRIGTSRERQRVRSMLVAAQMTLALVLLVAASLLLQSFRRLRAVDPGFEPAGVITAVLNPSPNRYGTTAEVWSFYRDVLERVRAIPGVMAAGLSEATPLGGSGCTVQGFEDASVYERVRASENTTCAAQESTTPGYFETFGIPLLRGRTFIAADNDRPDAGAVVVSKAFADRFWPGEDPIGKGVAPNGQSRPPFYRVVGVVGDVADETLGGNPVVAIYYPIVRIPNSGGWWPYEMHLYVKTSLEQSLALLPALRTAVREVDGTVPLSDSQEMQAIVDRSLSRVSFMMVLLGIAGAVALLLAAVGLYGVIAYSVTRRRSEIGVRLALGARPAQVLRIVIGDSIRLASVGVVAGVIVAFFASRLLRGLLYDVATTNAAAYVASAAVLGLVALLASWLPARRAARVQPADLIRMT
jgi:predicted permease